MNNPRFLFSRRKSTWKTVGGKIRSAANVALFLDYDGTLTPIVQRPEDAILSPAAENVLRTMANLPRTRVFIVTGRSMDDIRRIVPIAKIGFAANHGLHIYQRGTMWMHPELEAAGTLMQRMYKVLCTALADVPGVFIEDKKITLSIHYRKTPSRSIRRLKTLVYEKTAGVDASLKITSGKKVLEVRPAIDWGKGKAVLRMINMGVLNRAVLPVFIGDDTTDESVFEALRFKGITICVGKKTATSAQYWVHDVDEVIQLLELIIILRKGIGLRFQMTETNRIGMSYAHA